MKEKKPYEFDARPFLILFLTIIGALCVACIAGLYKG